MANETEIREAFARLLRQLRHDVMLSGEVVGVDADAKTVDVQPADGGAVYYAIRLRVATADEGMGVTAQPAMGAQVLCAMLDSNEGVLLFATRLESYTVAVSDDISLHGTADGWVMNGGQYGGLVLVGELVKRLNKLESRVNDLLTWMKTHTHPTAAIGPPSIATPIPDMTAAQPIQATDKKDLENPKITQ